MNCPLCDKPLTEINDDYRHDHPNCWLDEERKKEMNSKLPWGIRQITGKMVQVIDSDGNVVAQVYDGSARLIVTAVNNHARLVEAMKTIREFSESLYGAQNVAYNALAEIEKEKQG